MVGADSIHSCYVNPINSGKLNGVDVMSEPSYDPAREWDRHCEEEARYLANRQLCNYCEEPIAEDSCYEIDGQYICEDCLKDYMNEHYRVSTPVYDDEGY